MFFISANDGKVLATGHVLGTWFEVQRMRMRQIKTVITVLVAGETQLSQRWRVVCGILPRRTRMMIIETVYPSDLSYIRETQVKTLWFAGGNH